MVKKLLTLAALILGMGSSTYAQTDVTSTYLTNADFSESTALTDDYLYGYGKDGTPYGLQNVDGWTSIVLTGDNSQASYPNSGMGGGVISYGSSTKLKGNNNAAPSAGPDGNSGNCLGYFAVWSLGGYYYQEVTLAAGQYTINIPAYNASGTQSNTSYIGWIPNSGDSYTMITNPTVGSWVTLTTTFTLTEETTGKICLGYQSTGSGSSANNMIFFDKVQILYTDPDAAAHAAELEANKYTLNGYIKKATALNGVLADETLATAITTAQGVYDAATDYSSHNDGVVSASSDLRSAIDTALSGMTVVSLTNGNFDTDVNIAADGTNSGTMSSTATEAKPYIWEVTGWTTNFTFSATASQGNTAVYGAACSGTNGTNGTNSPATDMFGDADGGTLHLSSGWNDQARYYQNVTELPAGRYFFYYEANNQNSNATSINSNYFGVSGESGNFYGTTNSFVYDNKKTFPYNDWVACAFEFDVAKTANINFNVGIIGTTAGSANGAKLWIDNVQVYRIGDVIVSDEDATSILSSVEKLDDAVYNADDKSALATAKSNFENNKTLENYNTLNAALIAAQESVDIYANLNTAITNIEGWTAYKTSVTDPIRAKYTNGEYTDETTAADIYSVYQAAEMAAIVEAEGTDYTSAILNPSFETGDLTGWSAESRNDTGVKANSNSTYTTSNVDGDYLFNSWGGSAENNVYQTIPNLPAGTYALSALVAGFNGEELVISANEETASITVAGDKTIGYTATVVFTLDAASNVLIKASNTKSQSASDASFIKADNFTLKAYSDPLAALKEQLAALQAEATTTLADETYVNVTGEEKTTLSTLTETTPEETEEAYNTAIIDITTAINSFKAAKDSYDAFVAAKAATADPELAYASDAKKEAFTTAVTATATTAADAVTKTAAIPTALRAYYESHALAEGVEDAVVYNSAVSAANADTNTGWTNGIGTNTGEGYTDAEGNVASIYLDGGWSGSAGVNIDMTRSVAIPAGKYLLTVTARGAINLDTYTLSIGGNTVNLPTNGSSGGVFNRGWDDVSVEFEADGNAQTLEIVAKSTASMQWISINRFRLVQLEKNDDVYAGTTEYDALNAAIEAAEAYTLGFDAGEYAPYNNIEAVTALATAKSINQEADNLKETVTGATTALTSATWTANTTEVNAIFDGQFATTEANTTSGDITLPGWTKVNGIRLLVKDEATDPGLEYTDGKAAVFSWGGTTLTYGEQTGYTLPLNKHSVYALTLKISGWRDGDMPTYISATLDDETIVNTSFSCAAINSTESNPFAEVKFLFTPTADNSILKFYGNKHFTIADLELMLVPTIEIAGTTVKANKYTTFISEIARELPEGVTAYSCTELNGAQLTLVTAEDAIKANTPYILENTTDADITIAAEDGQSLKVDDAYTVGLLTGVYTDTPITSGYVLQTQNNVQAFYAVDSESPITVPANKCYLTYSASGAKVLSINGDATAIEAIEALTSGDYEAIYSTSGARLNSLQKGVNIVKMANGKTQKILVK